MTAIREVAGNLSLAVDPHDSVGILDSYFPECRFFAEYPAFIRHLEKVQESPAGERIDFVSICTPNHLHFPHIVAAMTAGADAICEKPLVIDPAHLDVLEEVEGRTGRRVYSIFQLRLHPALIALKQRLESERHRDKYDLSLTYTTRRGPWYHVSWKGKDDLSGGLAMNIGIHFFDAMIWLFGGVERSELHLSHADKIAGMLELERARVRWYLSIDIADLPEGHRLKGKTAFRSITLDGEELDFTDGFTDLHTESYRQILAGNGFGIDCARTAIRVVNQLGHMNVTPDRTFIHDLLKR
jgi:UDP-N-acetyl-2-amino-2-deoxyglucuronate dehydrogenase